MSKATDTLRGMDDWRDQRMFQEHLDYFLRRYRPEDPQEAHEFEMIVHMLVRHIYLDAQKPGLDRLTALAMAAPPPTMIFPTEKK